VDPELLQLLTITFIAAVIADVSMLLGVFPFAFLSNMSDRVAGALSAGAGGMMIAASLVQLLGEGLSRAEGFGVLEVAAGLVAGGAVYAVAARWVRANKDFDVFSLRASGGAKSILIVAVMTVHSLPEGVAIGVAFGSREEGLGLAVVSALAVHNIPEAIAITLALRASGVGIWACAGWAMLTSVPQPIAAPFAAWLIWLFEPLLPAGMGFAAGAMTFLVIDDLLPEAFRKSSAGVVAWAFLAGVTAMMVLGRLVGL